VVVSEVHGIKKGVTYLCNNRVYVAKIFKNKNFLSHSVDTKV